MCHNVYWCSSRLVPVVCYLFAPLNCSYENQIGVNELIFGRYYWVYSISVYFEVGLRWVKSFQACMGRVWDMFDVDLSWTD